MGAISAEARGLVRQQLARLNTPPDDSVPVRLQHVVEGRTRCFRQGKRLKEDEIADLNTELIRGIPVLEVVDQTFVYPHYALASVVEKDRNFQEGAVIVRCLRLTITRRRVSFFDHMIGAMFSFHSLCRIIERASLSNPLIEHILQHSPTAAAHLIVLWKEMCGDNGFAIPFADGLAIGTFTTMDFNAPSIEFVANKTGGGFPSTDAFSLWRDSQQRVHAGAIRTFLSVDQLNFAQEKLLDQWHRIRRVHGAPIKKLQECVLQNDLCERREFERFHLEVRGEVHRLINSQLWHDVVHSS